MYYILNGQGEKMEEIRRMQENLLLIRRAIGWTAEDLGKQIGVTRQTINNIEKGRNRLTKTQYIAIRSVIDEEIKKHMDETEMVRVLLDVFVDHPEKYSKEDSEKLLTQANMIAPSILAGTATRKDVSKEWIKSVNLIGITTVAIVAGTLSKTWITKICKMK